MFASKKVRPRLCWPATDRRPLPRVCVTLSALLTSLHTVLLLTILFLFILRRLSYPVFVLLRRASTRACFTH